MLLRRFTSSILKSNLTASLKSFSVAHKKVEAPKQATTDISQRFHDLYVTELKRLEKSSSLQVESKYKVRSTSSPSEAYVHPYHSRQFPVFWSSIRFDDIIQEVAGPEPVSPHYESFLMSRRGPLILMGVVYLVKFADNLNLTNMYGRHAAYQLYTLLAMTVCIFESRYITQRVPAPRLTWFYASYLAHELDQAMLSWQDRLEEHSKIFLAASKEQIDYFSIHKEFVYIKKRSISNYIENEKKNLDKLFYDRTVNMLKLISKLEDSNVTDKIKEISEESLKEVLKKLEEPQEKARIQGQLFKSALIGLKSGRMEYQEDPILPLLLAEIKKRTTSLKNLSKEEENKLFSLNAYQKKQVIDSDNRAKIDYLSQAPNVSSAGVKNSEVYKGIINRMKSRIEANFSGK